MARIFRSSELPFAEALRRYAPARAAQRAAQPVPRAAQVTSKDARLLSPWPFSSWEEFARERENEQRRRKLALVKHRAGLLI